MMFSNIVSVDAFLISDGGSCSDYEGTFMKAESCAWNEIDLEGLLYQQVKTNTLTVFICPITIAYRMEHIIKSVCSVYVYPCVGITVAFLDRFSPKIGTDVRTSVVKSR